MELTRLEVELREWQEKNRALKEQIRQLEDQLISRQTPEEKEAASLLWVCQIEYTKQLSALLKQLRVEDRLHERILLDKYEKLDSLRGVLQEMLSLISKTSAES